MRQKNFIKEMRKAQADQRRQELRTEFSKHFGALYRRPKRNFIHFIKANPIKSFISMMLLLGLNFLWMLYWDTSHINKEKVGFANIGEYLKNTHLGTSPQNHMPLSLGNILTLREIQDSLQYYADKKDKLTASDTLILKRLLIRYASVDPSIFNNKSATKSHEK